MTAGQESRARGLGQTVRLGMKALIPRVSYTVSELVIYTEIRKVLYRNARFSQLSLKEYRNPHSLWRKLDNTTPFFSVWGVRLMDQMRSGRGDTGNGWVRRRGFRKGQMEGQKEGEH